MGRFAARWRCPRVAFLVLVAGLLALPASAPASTDSDWYVTAYGAVLAGGDLGETFAFSNGFDGSWLLALAVGRELGTLGPYLRWELEGQAAQHFGEQHHEELNGLIALRWLPFPWDRYLDTSFAFGEGLSLATRVPAIEARRHQRSSALLDYLLFEFAFSLPDVPRWSTVVRIHHRSGAWGTFNGVEEGSNFLGAGLRHDF